MLNGVAAISPTDVWAVGSVGDPAASLERALVLHWDGTAWADVEIGRATGGGKAALVDIQGVSPTDLWAVGYQHFQPLILRFDGEAWSRSPTEIRGTLHAIEAFATSQVWAVGTPIQRFDGETWTEAPITRADAELVDVAAIGGRDIWAVGSRPAKGRGPRARPSTATAATGGCPSRAPRPGSDALTAVDALPDGTLLAVGWKDVDLRGKPSRSAAPPARPRRDRTGVARARPLGSPGRWTSASRPRISSSRSAPARSPNGC